jgi:hypothetical protein
MTDQERIEILKLALRKACQWLRQNPPGDLSQYDKAKLRCLICNSNDPDGEKWMNYFLGEAIYEIMHNEP